VAKCKGCGAEIRWAKTADGKFIPLQNCKHVYELKRTKDRGDTAIKYHLPMWISHFLTCPKANDFSGSKKNPQTTMEL